MTNSVRITVRDLKRLGAILDQLVTLGSNQIGAIAFAIDDPKKLQNEARRRATKDAIAKAELYAESANFGLVKIVAITEDVAARLPRLVMAPMAVEARAANVYIKPGEQTIRVRVNVIWEIK